MSAKTFTNPCHSFLIDTCLSEILTTPDPFITTPKLAINIYPYFELKNYLYSLYQSLTAADNIKVSDIAVDNFFRGRDTIISIDKVKDESRFNLRISSSKEGSESWHRNNWCLNKDKIAYVILNPLELEPFTMAIEELIEEMERFEF